MQADRGTYKMVSEMQTRAELYAPIRLHEYEALDASILESVRPPDIRGRSNM
jgi:methylisocitrate lyase